MIWITFLALLMPVLATFVPSADQTSYTASDQIVISWKDDGQAPPIKDFTTGTFKMCAIVSGVFNCDVTLAKSISIADMSSKTFDLSDVSSQGPSGSYILQLTGVAKDGSYVVTYSLSWFRVTGFTGAGIAVAGGVPGNQYSDVAAQPSWTYSMGPLPASLSTIVSSWQIPYTFQSGPERWAPFQLTPGTTVTQSLTLTRRFPTSAYSTFTALVNTLMPYTTHTPGASTSPTLYFNYAPTATVAYTGVKPSKVTATLKANKRRRWMD